MSRLDGVQTLNAFDSRGLPLSAFQRSALTATVLRMTGVPRKEVHERRVVPGVPSQPHPVPAPDEPLGQLATADP